MLQSGMRSDSSTDLMEIILNIVKRRSRNSALKYVSR